MEEARMEGVVAQMLRRTPNRRPNNIPGPEKFTRREEDPRVDMYSNYDDSSARFSRPYTPGYQSTGTSTKQRNLSFQSARM